MTDFRNLDPDPILKIEDLPEVEDGQYPPNAQTKNQRIRYRACLRMARLMFPPEEGQSDEALIWQTARSLYDTPEVTI